MAYVNITALTYPAGAEEIVEKRFAHRKKDVDTHVGFESFELLRPVEGESRYFVITRWTEKADYDAWFAQRPERPEDPKDAGMSVEVLGFEAVEL